MTCTGASSANIDAEEDGARRFSCSDGGRHLEEDDGGVAVGVIGSGERVVFAVEKGRGIGPRFSVNTRHFTVFS